MRTFRDAKNRQWTLDVNNETVQLLKDNLDVDLLQLAVDDGALMRRLAGNPFLMGNVVYWIVKDQCDAAGVDAKEFARAWKGSVADEAVPAFWAEVFDFFPKRQREALAAVWEKQEEMQGTALDYVKSRIRGPVVDRIMRAEMNRLDETLERRASESGETSGSSPEKSQLIPVP